MECTVGEDELWEELGAHAGVPGMLMLGHYTSFTGVYGDRWIRGKISGRIDQLRDATIEKWANWAGPPGAFAAALRALCTDADSGELRGARWMLPSLRSRYIPLALRFLVLSRDGYKCVNCGTTEQLEIDHVFPFAEGGETEPRNLQTLCLPCNCSKGDKVA